MTTTTILVCDVCAGQIHADARAPMFALIVLTRGEREVSRELPHVCGDACAMKALGALLREVSE